MVMLQSPFKLYINIVNLYTIISQCKLTNSTPWEEIIIFFYNFCFSECIHYGTCIILILMYHMIASSNYSKHYCSRIIFPFDMTNDITTSVHLLLYQYFIVYSPPNDMSVLVRPSKRVSFVCNFRLSYDYSYTCIFWSLFIMCSPN